jgi:folate-binding protein YgfZ
MQAYRIERDVVRVSGPDAASYLQGQLSQDVASLAVGGSARALLLQPTGKTVAWLRVSRVGEHDFVLDTDPGIGESMLARLNRFKLRTDCSFEPLAWQCVAVRGEGATVDRLAGSAEVAAGAEWPGTDGVDLLGPEVVVPEAVSEGSAAEFEALRVAAGIPVTGVDLAVDAIPNEGGRWLIDRSASFTKGCYTGQELLARVDSRGGNVPRPIRLVELGEGAVPPVGAEVLGEGDKPVGSITAVAGQRALGVVGRAVEPPASVTLRWATGEASATVLALPT